MPLVNSYQGDESAISIVLEGEDRGKKVCCHEGIYDEAEVVATSFINFLQYHAWCVVEDDAKLWEFI